jgi:hypothetical protein
MGREGKGRDGMRWVEGTTEGMDAESFFSFLVLVWVFGF